MTNGQQQGATQLDQLNENLKDVTRIMTKNMEDLLWRGDSLDREYHRAAYRPKWDRRGVRVSQ